MEDHPRTDVSGWDHPPCISAEFGHLEGGPQPQVWGFTITIVVNHFQGFARVCLLAVIVTTSS